MEMLTAMHAFVAMPFGTKKNPETGQDIDFNATTCYFYQGELLIFWVFHYALQI